MFCLSVFEKGQDAISHGFSLFITGSTRVVRAWKAALFQYRLLLQYPDVVFVVWSMLMFQGDDSERSIF